jgi:PAS domain S-box-containing protein
MTSLYAASKPEILSRNATSEAHATSARAPRIDVIDGAARVVAALTLTGTAALLAPPLAAALGPATLSAPFYLAIVLIAGTLGYACAFAAIGASALALIVESPSLASGALSIGDALGILMFATTSIIIAAVLSRLPRERARARSLAQFARTCAGERDDAREAREALRARLLVQRDWYEAAMQTVDDVLVAVDVHGRVQFVSAAIERLTACSVANALGARLDDVVRTASDDGAAYIASARAAGERSLHDQDRRRRRARRAMHADAGALACGRPARCDRARSRCHSRAARQSRADEARSACKAGGIDRGRRAAKPRTRRAQVRGVHERAAFPGVHPRRERRHDLRE